MTDIKENGESPRDADEDIEPQEQPGAPSLFLQKIVGQKVLVRLNSGIDYSGILSCLDGYMNIAMEDTVELVNGTEKGRFGDAFIRGNNGMSFIHSTNKKCCISSQCHEDAIITLML